MNPDLERLLKKTCMNCPIFDDCLDYSLRVKVKGFWAGTTERKRVQLRKMFDITPIRIDEEYNSTLKTETNQAKNSRTYRERQKEMGAR